MLNSSNKKSNDMIIVVKNMIDTQLDVFREIRKELL